MAKGSVRKKEMVLLPLYKGCKWGLDTEKMCRHKEQEQNRKAFKTGNEKRFGYWDVKK